MIYKSEIEIVEYTKAEDFQVQYYGIRRHVGYFTINHLYEMRLNIYSYSYMPSSGLA